MIIDILKNEYSLWALLDKLQLSKSSYYYQVHEINKEELVPYHKRILSTPKSPEGVAFYGVVLRNLCEGLGLRDSNNMPRGSFGMLRHGLI